MRRNTLNFVLDLASTLVMLGMIATGLLLRLVLPPGSGSRRLLWGWGRHDWGELHFYLAMALGMVIVLHVALHWRWVCATAVRCFPHQPGDIDPPRALKRNFIGGAFALVLLGLVAGFVYAANHQVREITVGGGETALHRGPDDHNTIAGDPLDRPRWRQVGGRGRGD